MSTVVTLAGTITDYLLVHSDTGMELGDVPPIRTLSPNKRVPECFHYNIYNGFGLEDLVGRVGLELLSIANTLITIIRLYNIYELVCSCYLVVRWLHAVGRWLTVVPMDNYIAE